MITVTPVSVLGDPNYLDVTPKETEKTILFSDLPLEKRQAAIDAAMRLGGEICIVTVDDAIVVVKGYNDERGQVWGSNQPLRYALFNAKRSRRSPLCDYVFVFVQEDSANNCRFRSYFEHCPGAVS